MRSADDVGCQSDRSVTVTPKMGSSEGWEARMERPGVSAQPPSLGPHRAVGSHRHGALHRTAEELHFTEAECVRFQQPLNTECVKHILEMFLVNAGIKEFELGLDPGRGLARATTEP
jgi:hypothetical protein